MKLSLPISPSILVSLFLHRIRSKLEKYFIIIFTCFQPWGLRLTTSSQWGFVKNFPNGDWFEKKPTKVVSLQSLSCMCVWVNLTPKESFLR